MSCMSLDISVVVSAYSHDRWDYLIAAVESLKRQSASAREIIVVIDNNPSLMDRARETISGVIVCENEGAPGASGARNTGVTVAKGSIVAFMDDDAEASPDWLHRLNGSYKDPRVMGVGGALKPVWQGGRPSWFPEEFYWVVGCTYVGLPTTAGAVRNLIAANMSVRRDIFESLGGFRKGFGKVGARARPEETELCIRALQLKPESIWRYDPEAVVYHKVPPSRRRPRYFLTRCYDEGMGKAELSSMLGTKNSLSNEWSYSRHVLPLGLVRGLHELFSDGDLNGAKRSLAILGGLTSACIGYLIGASAAWLRGTSKVSANKRLARCRSQLCRSNTDACGEPPGSAGSC